MQIYVKNSKRLFIKLHKQTYQTDQCYTYFIFFYIFVIQSIKSLFLEFSCIQIRKKSQYILDNSSFHPQSRWLCSQEFPLVYSWVLPLKILVYIVLYVFFPTEETGYRLRSYVYIWCRCGRSHLKIKIKSCLLPLNWSKYNKS